MNDEQNLETSPVEYEESGPRYSESYLARIGRFQQMSANRNSANSVSRSSEINYDALDEDRSVISAPLRDFVEEDDKEAENITIPDRLCQPESPTVSCNMGNPESSEPEPVISDHNITSEEIYKVASTVSETVKIQRQSSEEKERTFGSLGPMNRVASDTKETTTLHNRSRSQVSGWAKLFASTLQRSKSTVSQDANVNMQKNMKSRPIRKSEQPLHSVISSNSVATQDTEIPDPFMTKTEMRKKKRSIGVDMREKLGFFRKQFADNSPITNMNVISNNKTNATSPTFILQLEKVWKSTGGPPNKDQITSWSNSFEDLLNDKHGISLFLEFLRSEFSDENLEFWSACQAYRSIGCPKKLQEKAIEIYEDYVAEQSPREINIDSVTRIQTSLDISHATANTFDQSQKKIQALMEKDSYQRFLRSEIYHYVTMTLNDESHFVGRLPHTNSLTTESESTRVSYIPGLLPKVTAGTKSHQLRTNTNPSLLSITTTETHKTDSNEDHGHHRSAPSSPKNITASTLS